MKGPARFVGYLISPGPLHRDSFKSLSPQLGDLISFPQNSQRSLEGGDSTPRKNSCEELFTFLHSTQFYYGLRDNGCKPPENQTNMLEVVISDGHAQKSPPIDLYMSKRKPSTNVPLPANGPCTPSEVIRVQYNRTQSTHTKFNGGMEKLTTGFFPTSTKGGESNTYQVLYGSKAPAELYLFDGRKALRPRSKPCLAT